MEFNLEGEEFIPLQALLKVVGVFDTGGEAKVAITSGQVKVDGKVEVQRGKKIRAGQVVSVAGQEIRVLA